MSYIDLRDLKGTEKREWKKAIEEQTGYDFDKLADNEPTMIPEREFKDYAWRLAEDIGAINPKAGWPINCIDWDQAADELKQDYSEVEVDGTTYYFRSY